MSRLAVVTGGSRGIGRACCEKLLSLGYEVVFYDVDDASAERFLSEADNPELHYFPCDVSSFGRVQDVGRGVQERFGPASALVNNAGIQTHCLFEDMTEELWDQTMDTDLKSVFSVCRSFVPGMRAQGYGRIVNIASMSARRGSSRHTHYCAAKAGVVGFTRALSLEIADCGVTVNAICPGIVETEIIRETLAVRRETWLSEMHVKRLGQPEDIANAVEFLVRRESSWITGQAFDINGGIITP